MKTLLLISTFLLVSCDAFRPAPIIGGYEQAPYTKSIEFSTRDGNEIVLLEVPKKYFLVIEKNGVHFRVSVSEAYYKRFKSGEIRNFPP